MSKRRLKGMPFGVNFGVFKIYRLFACLNGNSAVFFFFSFLLAK